MMLHFDSDYMEGAHPKILERLNETNFEQSAGYGADLFSELAKEKIRKAINCLDAEIYFLSGGTQTNSLVIKSLLQPYEGVLSADSGHICDHEAGAIESTGHKVLTLPHTLGKITATQIETYMESFNKIPVKAHMVQPGMIYISHPTEYGTLYTKNELEALKAVSKHYKLPLFIDGARLGYGLVADGSDVSLEVVAQNCDVFYIGGTKVGALFGEALVFPKPYLVKHFFTLIKQHGALLAKGRILGIQFDTLFTDNLYLDISKHALHMAYKLKAAFIEKGYTFHIESITNQQFVVFDHEKMNALKKHMTFSEWEPLDTKHTVVRFCTSWATKESDIDQLIQLI